jgi:hypothetical protein
MKLNNSLIETLELYGETFLNFYLILREKYKNKKF